VVFCMADSARAQILCKHKDLLLASLNTETDAMRDQTLLSTIAARLVIIRDFVLGT